MEQDTVVQQRIANIAELAELTSQPRWVVWRLEPNPKKPKPDKIPYTPGTRRKAKADDPSTWGTFADALAAYQSAPDVWAGIGFELGGSGITGVDLDHCIDPTTGGMHPAALKVVSTLDTYAEISQSGTGIHSLAKAQLPPGGRRTGKGIPWGAGAGELEVYDTGRFFALTGNHLPDTPLSVEDRQQEVAELHALFFSPKPAAATQPSAATLSKDDKTVVELMRKVSKYAALYDQGDTSDYPSHSEADLALAGALAFYCGPSQEVQVDRIFRASKLMRDKWDETHGDVTYGEATIAKAYQGRTKYYSPNGQRTTSALADPLDTPDTPDDAIPAVDEYLTDLGNARRLVRMFCRDMRFVSEWGWLVWDGKRWAPDRTGNLMRWAKRTALSLYDDAANALDKAEQATRDEKQRAAAGDKAGAARAAADSERYSEQSEEVKKWARTSQMRQRLEAMVVLAQSELAVVARPDAFDRDPLLFNCDNGTIDLRTGELRQHERGDLITKISPVAYDPAATCETWDKFLATTTQGDQDHQGYLQRALGYTLTGDTREEVFFIVLGPPASGKTTFVEAASAMMGDYAHSASFDTFLQRKDVGAARGDIADLMGARLVAACEAEPTRHLAEVMINHLTGGDRVTARHIYQREFTFTPSCKVWLAANESPKISDTNSAVWRRLRRLPFEHEIPEGERDPNVKATLKDPQRGGPAVLRWAVEGCLQWQKIGLATPKVIRDKSADLRSAMDPMGDFFAECCVFTPYAEVPAGVLRAEYETWCRSRGEREQVGSKEWGERLRAKGAHSHKLKREGRNVSLWLGIGLKEAEDTATTATTATEESVTFEQTKNENLLREVTENAVAPVAPVAADAPAEAVTTDQGPAAPAGVSVDPARVTIRDAVTYHEMLTAGVPQATAANLILDFDRWIDSRTLAYPGGWADAQQVYESYVSWISAQNTHPDGSALRITPLPKAERGVFDRLMQRAGFPLDGRGFAGVCLT